RTARGLGELRAARAAEDRAAGLDDAADVARGERLDAIAQQSGIAVAHAEDFPAARQRAARHRAHRGVHARGVAAAREDRDALHRCRFLYSISVKRCELRKPLAQTASNSAVGLDACTSSRVRFARTCSRMRPETALSMS